MVVIIMTNSFMGVSCFHRSGIYGSSYNGKLVSSCGFSNSQKLIYRVGWSRINVEKIRFLDFRMLTVGAVNALSKGETDNVLSGGGILEKEFEFRPTFDEYLKTLESVRTGREKKQTHRSDRDKVKHDSSGSDVLETPILERGEKDVKLRDSGGFPKGKKMSKVGKHQVNGNDKGIAAREGKVRHDFDHEERGIGESRNRLNREKRGRDEIVPIIVGGQAMKTKHSKDSRLGKSKKLQDPQEGSVISYNAHSKGSTIDKKGELGRNRTSTDMLGRKEKSFKGENFGVTLSKDRIQAERDAEKRTVSSSLRLIRSSKKASGIENYGSSLEMERAAFKNFEEPIDVVNKPGVPRIEMEERIQKLAKWLNGADIDVPEWTFSKTMRSAKIKYTDHTILRVIQILGKLGNWRRVLQVIEWLQMRERFKSHKLRYIYTTALHVLGKARRPVEALNVFHAMQQQMSSYPDLVAYHSIAVTLGQAGHMKELFDVIDSMKSPPKKMLKTSVLVKWDPRLEPDIVVYNAVLNACVQRKQWEGAFWVLQQLKQQGQRPTASTYGLVMEVMFACGKYNLVHEFFRKVQKSSIPNSLAYRVLVNTLWKEGKIDEAVWAVQDMERRGIVGSAALYYDLARCLCSAGRCQEGLMLIEKICKVANKPLVVTYTGLIQACLDSGNMQNGAHIFNKMKDFCAPNLVTYNIMLKAYMEHGLFEGAMKLFKEMSEGGNPIESKSDYKDRVLPDTYTFNTMLDACVAEKRWNDFEYVYRRMLHHGYHFNPKRHLRMVLDACRGGKKEVLETTWEHLMRANRIPPPLIKERLCMKLEDGDHISAISSIPNDVPKGDMHAFSKTAWLDLLKENAQRFEKETLLRLIEELNILVAENESGNPVLQNLLRSCIDFSKNW